MVVFEVDITSQLPVWVQLRNRFTYLIKTGYFRPGDQLPSVRSLAATAAINYNTVSKAYMDLERDGYVYSARGRGVFVCERDEGASERDEVLSCADELLRDAVRRCLLLGMSVDEVRERFVLVAEQVEGAQLAGGRQREESREG